MASKKREKIVEMTKKLTGDETEFSDQGLPIEGEKDPASHILEDTCSQRDPHAPEVVRGQDVLKILRDRGIKI
jgi:hypothetical protein